MITESFKQELLARVDIVDVIDARVPLKKTGANFSARCPFHTEKTPSFSVSPTKQFYHCFGCGVHGNVIGFLMEYAGLGYVEAVRELAEGVGMKMPAFEAKTEADKPNAAPANDLFEVMVKAMQFYRDELKGTPAAIDYLKKRGLTGQIAARFGIGYAPAESQGLRRAFPQYDAAALVECGLIIEGEGGRRYDRFRDRVMFPIINLRGQVIGFGGRIIGAGEPKYLNSPETPLFEKRRELYGLREARESIRKDGGVVVVEGYMDVVALAQHGIENAVATLGTATTSNHIVKLLRQAEEIVFCFDGDAAGRKAAWHALEVSLPSLPDGKMVRFLILAAEHDPDSFVRAEGADAFRAMAATAAPLSEFMVGELVRRSPVTTAEGRSRFVNEAKPLLQKMVAPILQLQLIRDVARRAELDEQDLTRLLGMQTNRPAASIRTAAARSTMWRPAMDPRQTAPTRGMLIPMRRLEWTMLQSIMARPELASAELFEYESSDYLEGRALTAVVASLREDPTATAGLIERFQNTEHAPILDAVCAELLRLNIPDGEIEADLKQALLKVQLGRIQERLVALTSSSTAPQQEGADGASQGEQVLELLRRKGELQRALGSVGGVV
ncbi:MAG: DNA primase [Betaproteobacteria bacterium]|nr:DNA primase [Betaproteobacteria bacterium]